MHAKGTSTQVSLFRPRSYVHILYCLCARSHLKWHKLKREAINVFGAFFLVLIMMIARLMRADSKFPHIHWGIFTHAATKPQTLPVWVTNYYHLHPDILRFRRSKDCFLSSLHERATNGSAEKRRVLVVSCLNLLSPFTGERGLDTGFSEWTTATWHANTKPQAWAGKI